MLKIDTKPVHIVNDHDFEKWVADMYPKAKPLSVQSAKEAADDITVMIHNVDGAEFNAYDAANFEKWVSGEGWEMFGTIDLILNDQVRKNAIPAGDYGIVVVR